MARALWFQQSDPESNLKKVLIVAGYRSFDWSCDHLQSIDHGGFLVQIPPHTTHTHPFELQVSKQVTMTGLFFSEE